ncbi:hypothetical protein K7I13_14280 [Brucepastera parasyntrophica]|uniref:hypothetical protein n=1 Tax=Brucepastera parasyntrophica TaxID=2880008 RepID=UPI00210A0222|nr:hypothetical protein [Brucepastera parasyntrophica]ULQ59608.1 hypothetical protein K7I13_14280 [Brucepastera parasyntrophica]
MSTEHTEGPRRNDRRRRHHRRRDKNNNQKENNGRDFPLKNETGRQHERKEEKEEKEEKIPSLLNTLPVQNCIRCGMPIQDITSAMADKDSGDRFILTAS